MPPSPSSPVPAAHRLDAPAALTPTSAVTVLDYSPRSPTHPPRAADGTMSAVLAVAVAGCWAQPIQRAVPGRSGDPRPRVAGTPCARQRSRARGECALRALLGQIPVPVNRISDASESTSTWCPAGCTPTATPSAPRLGGAGQACTTRFVCQVVLARVEPAGDQGQQADRPTACRLARGTAAAPKPAGIADGKP